MLCAVNVMNSVSVETMAMVKSKQPREEAERSRGHIAFGQKLSKWPRKSLACKKTPFCSRKHHNCGLEHRIKRKSA
jgi:hypothetical protein